MAPRLHFPPSVLFPRCLGGSSFESHTWGSERCCDQRAKVVPTSAAQAVKYWEKRGAHFARQKQSSVIDKGRHCHLIHFLLLIIIIITTLLWFRSTKMNKRIHGPGVRSRLWKNNLVSPLFEVFHHNQGEESVFLWHYKRLEFSVQSTFSEKPTKPPKNGIFPQTH